MQIEKHDRVRGATFEGRRHSFDRSFPLVAGMHFEAGGTAFIRLVTEQDLLEVAQRRRCLVWLEVIAKATQVLTNDVLVVVDDEYTLD